MDMFPPAGTRDPWSASWVGTSPRQEKSPEPTRRFEREPDYFAGLPGSAAMSELRATGTRWHRQLARRDSTRRVALHEAAHTYVAAALDLPIRSVSIDHSDGAGETRIAHPEDLDVGFYAVMLAAGRAGESLAFSDEDPQEGHWEDSAKIDALLRDAIDPPAVKAHVRNLAEQVVAAGAAQIRALADVLARRGRVEGDEALAIIGEHGGIRTELAYEFDDEFRYV